MEDDKTAETITTGDRRRGDKLMAAHHTRRKTALVLLASLMIGALPVSLVDALLNPLVTRGLIPGYHLILLLGEAAILSPVLLLYGGKTYVAAVLLCSLGNDLFYGPTAALILHEQFNPIRYYSFQLGLLDDKAYWTAYLLFTRIKVTSTVMAATIAARTTATAILVLHLFKNKPYHKPADK